MNTEMTYRVNKLERRMNQELELLDKRILAHTIRQGDMQGEINALKDAMTKLGKAVGRLEERLERHHLGSHR